MELKQHTYRIIRILLKYTKQKELVTQESEIDQLWEQVEQRVLIQRLQRERRYRLYLSIAASIALLVMVGYVVFDFRSEKSVDYLVEYAQETRGLINDTDEIKLMLSDKKEMTVKNNADIVYLQEGTVSINKDTVKYQTDDFKKKEEINQIVIPKGKRAQLTLSDGTRLWINAGTRVIYPNSFQSDRREIFVDGEIYLEVAHNKKVPFFVSTKNFKVQVLGTKFDVSSYESETMSSVVLVDGSVKIVDQTDKETILVPNQLINIQEGQLSFPITVDVRKYICWIDDLLIYEDEPLSGILKKLELYYGKRIVFNDDIDRYRASGKLDLKESLEDVLHTISYSFSVQIKEDQGVIYIK